MDSKFEYFVEISGQKYETALSESGLNSILFKDIYPKVQQIVRIGLNEDIDFNTHEFELFENNSSKGSQIKSLNVFIKNKSLIRITSKPKQEMSPLMAGLAINPLVSPHIKTETEEEPTTFSTDFTNDFSTEFIPLANATSNYLTLPQNTNQLPAQQKVLQYNYYCNVCPINSDTLTGPLSKCRLFLSEKNFKIYSHLLRVMNHISDYKFGNITKEYWDHDIPKAMGMDIKVVSKLSDKLEFRLKSYAQVLEKCPNPVIACNLFPFFHIFESMDFDTNDMSMCKIDCKKITVLRQMRKQFPDSTNLEKVRKSLETSVNKLINCENDIKAFHTMIMNIELNWNLRDRQTKTFWLKTLSNRMIEQGYMTYGPSKLVKQFSKWTEFYAMKFHLLDGKLDERNQKIFDLLKVIHILDLNKIMYQNNGSFERIIEISAKQEFKDYYEKHLNSIRIKKLDDLAKFNENRKRKFSGFSGSEPSVESDAQQNNSLKTICDNSEPTQTDCEIKTEVSEASILCDQTKLKSDSKQVSKNSSNTEKCETERKKLKPTLTIFLD